MPDGGSGGHLGQDVGWGTKGGGTRQEWEGVYRQ